MTSRVTTTLINDADGNPITYPTGTSFVAGESVHILTLDTEDEGALLGGTGGTAEAVLEAETGSTAPFTAMFVGGDSSLPTPTPGSPIGAADKEGLGFWQWLEEVNAPLQQPTPPPTPLLPPTDLLETSAIPMVDLIEVTMPTSYQSDSLTGLNPDLNRGSLGPSNIFPGVNLVTADASGTGVTGAVVAGVGKVGVKAQITGNILELNSWVNEWNPTSSIPHFNGADYAKVRSEGFGRDNGPFVINFKLKFYLKLFPNHPDNVIKSYSIAIINNFENDRLQYKADYAAAYGSLTKVPELNERNY